MADKAQPSSGRIRLFVGVPLPDDVVTATEATIDAVRARMAGARWIPAENRHVTLAFLGPVEVAGRAWIEARLREVAIGASPFRTVTTRLGGFPSSERARVVWLGLDDAHGRFPALASRVQDALSPRFEPERRAFSPHITLARSSKPLTLADAEAPAPTHAEAGFVVDHIVLFRSHPGRPAPRYERLAIFRLDGGRLGEG